MALLIPTEQNYIIASNNIKNLVEGIPEKVDYCIYGSFLTGKIRPGLSDIDIFLLEHSNDILFSGDILKVFSEIKQNIQSIGIPLQITHTTTGALQNNFASPNYEYLKEVEKGMDGGYSSKNFANLFIQQRDCINDDLSMARHFLRKASDLPLFIYKMEQIIMKPKSEISIIDQKDLQKFWDSFKKMLSFCILSLRILKGNSLFSKSDKIIIDNINNVDRNIENLEYFLEILNKIKNIEDWYNFLKNDNGIEEIKKIYDTTFQDITKKASTDLSNFE